MNLLARKGQLKLATQGASLLRTKREALLKELMTLIQPLYEGHMQLDRALEKADRSLAIAEGLDGREYLRSLGLSLGSGLSMEVSEKKFWGVRLPEIKTDGRTEKDVRDQTAGVTTRALETADDFSKLTEAILQLLAPHIELTRLGLEVRQTSRRVNALEQVLVPRLEKDIKAMGQALEEFEREDMFRLRRIKKKREQS